MIHRADMCREVAIWDVSNGIPKKHPQSDRLLGHRYLGAPKLGSESFPRLLGRGEVSVCRLPRCACGPRTGKVACRPQSIDEIIQIVESYHGLHEPYKRSVNLFTSCCVGLE